MMTGCHVDGLLWENSLCGNSQFSVKGKAISWFSGKSDEEFTACVGQRSVAPDPASEGVEHTTDSYLRMALVRSTPLSDPADAGNGGSVRPPVSGEEREADSTPLSDPGKGAADASEKGGQSPNKRGVVRCADQRERDRKLNPLAKPQAKVSRAARDVIRAAVPDATDEETETYARAIIDQRHPDNLERYLRAFPAFRITEGIMAIRQRGAVALVAEAGRQVAVGRHATQFRDLCPRCSRSGHDADACPDRKQPSAVEQPSRPKLAVVETPCAAGEKCQRIRTPVPDGQQYHPVCKGLVDLHAAMPTARSASRDEITRNMAAEQLAERGAAASATSQDGSIPA